MIFPCSKGDLPNAQHITLYLGASSCVMLACNAGKDSSGESLDYNYLACSDAEEEILI